MKEQASPKRIDVELIFLGLFLLAIATVGFLSTCLLLGGGGLLWIIVILAAACVGINSAYFTLSHQSEVPALEPASIEQTTNSTPPAFCTATDNIAKAFHIFVAENSKLIAPPAKDYGTLMEDAARALRQDHADRAIQELLLDYSLQGGSLKSESNSPDSLRHLIEAVQSQSLEPSGRGSGRQR